ncbi:MAG: MFS transporter [Ignavibacteria bacterium]|nr:MFS transporter [Ignavibacteria bacterium]MBK9404008.1 MFS transporter [Ignavibacteria bacterium]
MNRKIFTRAVWIVSIVSLLTDISSEMLYPVMPVYLKSIGFSVLLIGLLEGLAEAIAGLSKGYFGKLSDVTGKRVPFVRLGYLMSSVSKPMLAMFVYPLWIFFARTIDRFGKGLRTSARDAILSEESTPENKGKIFGFHRGMDTLGAVLGPVAALIYLDFYPENYRTLFLFAFIPAIAAVSFTFLLKDKKTDTLPVKEKVKFFSFTGHWKESNPEYKKLVTGLFIFTLLNSSDIFLLLMVKNLGFSDQKVIMVYIFYNLVYALASLPVGILADKIGLKNNYIAGLIIFAIVYGGMALNPGIETVFFLFFCYGIYAASTEGISKAWITNISEKSKTATALGFYNGFNSIFSLIASVLAGFLWYSFGPEIMFAFSSAGTIATVIYFLVSFRKLKA